MKPIAAAFLSILLSSGPASGEEAEPPAPPKEIQEARARARLLHEALNGALQVMHRDFFREDEHMAIPSESLSDVFRELERSMKVNVSWLAVNAKAMNPAHRAKSPFEKKAAEALAGGRESYDAVEDETYRFAGAINLGNQCLKCHVPDRQSLEDRKASLVISMKLALPAVSGK